MADAAVDTAGAAQLSLGGTPPAPPGAAAAAAVAMAAVAAMAVPDVEDTVFKQRWRTYQKVLDGDHLEHRALFHEVAACSAAVLRQRGGRPAAAVGDAPAAVAQPGNSGCGHGQGHQQWQTSSILDLGCGDATIVAAMLEGLRGEGLVPDLYGEGRRRRLEAGGGGVRSSVVFCL